MFDFKRQDIGNAKVFRLIVNKYVLAFVTVSVLVAAMVYAYIRIAIPTERVADESQLIMQGDLNGDRAWDGRDREVLHRILAAPWEFSDAELASIDVNRNQAVDAEDIRILHELYAAESPYRLFADEPGASTPAPMPREFFRYQAVDEFVQRPVFLVDHPQLHEGPVAFLAGMRDSAFESPYLLRLSREIHDEAMRFSHIYARRKDALSAEEQAFLQSEVATIRALHEAGELYPLLLHLILLTEAGETLSTQDQSEFVKNVRLLAEDLREYLLSADYAAFTIGTAGWESVFAELDALVAARLGVELTLEELAPARDLTEIRNYLDRAEWQVYKSTSSGADFRELVSYAQKDRRYLRAVSNTSERHADTTLRNHNLPMMLLFGKAMDIAGNDKKAAVGLLDEAIRIPFFWVGAMPDRLRPSSVALEHFLLPGNMEDGSDKSRHWNVFGGLALYRTPEESLLLAFQREVEDVREADYQPEAMTEFIRDMIANCYGIYHVVSYQEI